MAQRKPYNPNTKYGRKKLREQAQRDYENASPAERAEIDRWKTGCYLIIILCAILGVLIYIAFTGDSKGAIKWLTR